MVNKKSAFIKDIFRDIKKSRGRFFSIVAIIALGVAFFSGLKISPQVMKFTADKYYDDYNLMDIRVVSTLGLTEDDLDAIKNIEGIDERGTYTLDALTEYQESEVVLRIHGFSSKDQINGVKLLEGRYPENADECIIESSKNGFANIKIGETIRLHSGKDTPLSDELENTKFTVVGIGQTPYYLSFEKGNSTIGNGRVRSFIMIPEANFKQEVFTDIYLTVKDGKKLNSYKDEYFNLIHNVTEKLEVLAVDRQKLRYEEVITKANIELDKGKKEYNEEKQKAEEELDKALKEIEDGKEEIFENESKLRREEINFNNKIIQGKENIAKAEKDLKDGELAYEQGLKTYNEKNASAEVEFLKAEGEIIKAEEAIIELEKAILEMELVLENEQLPEENAEKIKLELAETEIVLLATKEALENGKLELEKGKSALSSGMLELNKSKEILDESNLKLIEEKNNLEQGERAGVIRFKKAHEDIEKAKISLSDGEKEYLIAKEKAEKELDKAFLKIEDGDKDIKEIEKAKWYVLDRNSHYSYVDYGGSADRIDALSTVFSIFFALVAALVCLTTMTRMVDEQRVNIGTLKALGYSNGVIGIKYMLYALVGTILGCIIGIGIGYTLFPTVIFNAYAIMYVLPPISLIFNLPFAIGISTVAIILMTLTTYIASSNELKEDPSLLMRPRAPKMGKRILLERVPFIWKRFSFSYKVTIRNIFRYKRRFFMTVIGIAGCTALMLTGFGIKDSIRTVVDRQFGVLYNYDMNVEFDSTAIKYLEHHKEIESFELIFQESGSIEFNGETKNLSIIVPNDKNNFGDFVVLQDRKTEKAISIEDQGVVITEQVSKSLGIKIGDEIKLKNNDEVEKTVKVTGITENYTFNYVYLSSKYYEDIFEENIIFNEMLANVYDPSYESEEKLSKELTRHSGVLSVNFNSEISNNFEDTIKSLNYVVFIMIISAGALAFVVLYNLTNVNISERIREIATIKVLGFYDKEVSAYVYRENTILTIIGTLSGLFLGIFLHKYIMTTVEMDNIMFGMTLNMKSYFIAALLTIVFALLVNWAMYYKLKNIEMVESLKSID